MSQETKRVLIVDDEDVVCQSYERVLSDAGYQVRSAMNGKQALQEVQKDRPDLVLTDLRMPVMDGLTIIRYLRESEPEVRVIVVTGYPSEESAEEAAKLGVEEYLTKPLSPANLRRAATEALAPKTRRKAPDVSARPMMTVPVLSMERARRPAVAPVDTLQPEPNPTAPEPEPEPGKGEFLKSLGMLVAAPFLGLAYVLFLPFIGFAVLLGHFGEKLMRLIRGRREVSVD